LLHDILPTSSFPSDHAVVSMSFAMATLLWWLYSKKKFFTWSGVIFLVVSFIMTACRILTLVHWPSDILAWIGLWILVPLLLIIRPVRYTILKYIVNPLIRVEQWIVKKVFHYEQWDI
jgi:membrane-associated phospholipid phosphatase